LDLDDFRAWLGAYVRACRSNDPEDVAKLFSENAEYYPGPFEEPHRGRASIIKHWADDPWTVGPRFEAWVEPLVLQKVAGGALGVAEWRASYPEAHPRRRASMVRSSYSGSTSRLGAPSIASGAWAGVDPEGLPKTPRVERTR
jgi:hypothetical protein